MKRRNLIKSLSLLPLTAAMPSRLFGNSESTVSAVETGENIFRSLGVEPLINCRGTFTIIGSGGTRETFFYVSNPLKIRRTFQEVVSQTE